MTLLALTRRGRVRELSRPYTLRVRKGKRTLKRRGVNLRLCRKR
jgi:hypothetical protein